MNLLRDNALIFGQLLAIEEPHLVARYNKALKAFGERETQLTRFEIDMTGFSPEIAEEFGNRQYLDPNGVNRRFIIMTPEQENLPVVHTSFSNTAGLMHEFFQGNRRVISAITIKDALFGEIEDPVDVVDDIEDLLRINEVKFRVMSADDLLGKAAELRTLVDRLQTTDAAWRDDKLLSRMVELARATGDIRQNALVPDKLVFPHRSYWANHFGGVYLFHDERSMTVICDPEAPGFRRSRPWEVSYIDIGDRAQIFEFLARTGRLEMPQASWVEESGLFTHRAEMAVRDLIRRVEADLDFAKIDRIWLQTWMQRNARLIAEDGVYPFLQEMLREVMSTGQVKMREVRPDRRILLVRAASDHPDMWLTNQLIARLTPFDFVSRFVFDKQGFYETYGAYAENFRGHVVELLTNTYLPDKAALRARLYGIDGAKDNA
jgi:hypothetical protein